MLLHTYLIFSGFFGYRCIKHFCMRIYAAYAYKQYRQSDYCSIVFRESDLFVFLLGDR